jgi:5-methylcytosine-specific restriction endonuclease McrA
MPLDNEIIKTMLEIIKNDHSIMLEIIKLNNKEKPPSVEEDTDRQDKDNDDNGKNNHENAKKLADEIDEKKVYPDPNPIPNPVKRKYTKKSISATMRRKVWDEYIGKKIGEAKCLCCKMTDITQLTFHCGHIIPECKGGELTLSNLKPICSSCNSSMGTINMNDFMKTFE